MKKLKRYRVKNSIDGNWYTIDGYSKSDIAKKIGVSVHCLYIDHFVYIRAKVTEAWRDQTRLIDMSIDTLMAEYKGHKYCEVSLFPYGCEYRNMVGRELISRGITEQPNIFGAIPIRVDWSPL